MAMNQKYKKNVRQPAKELRSSPNVRETIGLGKTNSPTKHKDN